MLFIVAHFQCTLVSLSYKIKATSPYALPSPLCAAVVVSMETFSSNEACGGQHSSGRRWNNLAVRQSYTKLIYISKHEPWTVPYNVCCGGWKK